MSLIFFYGFETSGDPEILHKWDQVLFGTAGVSFEADQGREGSRNIVIPSNFHVPQKWVEAKTHMIAGVAWQPRSGQSGAGSPIMFYSSDDFVQIEVRAETDGRISVRRGQGGTQLGITTDPVLIFDDYNFIEARVFMDQVVGFFEIRVNTSTVLNVTGVDTVRSGFQVNVAKVGFSGHAGGSGARLDSIYIVNEDGPAPHNTFLGNVQVDTLFPTADGDLSNIPTLFPVGGSQSEKVDEALADDDTSYLESTAINQISTFEYGNIPVIVGGALILGVQFNTRAKKTTTGSRMIGILQRVAGVNSALNLHAVTDDYLTFADLHIVNPLTASGWSDAEVNAFQVGMEVL